MTLNVTEVGKYGITGDRHCPFQLLLEHGLENTCRCTRKKKKKKKHEI